MYIYVYIYMLPFHTENGKWKPRLFFLIPLLLVHRANGSYLFANRLNRLNGQNGLARLWSMMMREK